MEKHARGKESEHESGLARAKSGDGGLAKAKLVTAVAGLKRSDGWNTLQALMRLFLETHHFQRRSGQFGAAKYSTQKSEEPKNQHFFCPTLSRLPNVYVLRRSGCNLYKCLFISVVKMHKSPIGNQVCDSVHIW